MTVKRKLKILIKTTFRPSEPSSQFIRISALVNTTRKMTEVIQVKGTEQYQVPVVGCSIPL